MICLVCEREMTEGVPCLPDPKRTPNGDTDCSDCRVPPHGPHHPGCGVERCHHSYKWGGETIFLQAISCTQCAQEWCEREGHDYGDPTDEGYRDCIWCGEPEPTPHVWPPV